MFHLLWSLPAMLLHACACVLGTAGALSLLHGSARLAALAAVVVVACIGFRLEAVNALTVSMHLLVFAVVLGGAFGLLGKFVTIPAWTRALPLLLACLYLGCGWWSCHTLAETSYTVASKNAGSGRLRVAQISDVHLGATFDASGFEERMRRVQATAGRSL